MPTILPSRTIASLASCHRHVRLVLLVLAAGASASLCADELDPVQLVDAPGVTPGFDAVGVLRPIERTFLATRPVFSYRAIHVSGVLTEPGVERSTTMQTLSASFRWNLGSSLMLSYHPAWTTYSGDEFDDNFAHPVRVSFDRGFTRWNIRATHDYARSAEPQIETARQTTQESHSTALRSQRDLGRRTTLELAVQRDSRTAQGFADFEQWSTEEWLHYQVSDAISASAGHGFGVLDVEETADMRFHRFNGRLRWRMTERLRMDARAGVDLREFVDSELPDLKTPVYGANLQYQPLPTTVLGIRGERSVSPSYFGGVVNRGSSWQVQLGQRIFERYYLDLAFVRRTARQRSANEDVIASREDNARSISARIGTHFGTRGHVAVFYSHKRNSSTDDEFGFTGQNYGLEVSLSY